jgi:hypothetical protein
MNPEDRQLRLYGTMSRSLKEKVGEKKENVNLEKNNFETKLFSFFEQGLTPENISWEILGTCLDMTPAHTTITQLTQQKLSPKEKEFRQKIVRKLQTFYKAAKEQSVNFVYNKWQKSKPKKF